MTTIYSGSLASIKKTISAFSLETMSLERIIKEGELVLCLGQIERMVENDRIFVVQKILYKDKFYGLEKAFMDIVKE